MQHKVKIMFLETIRVFGNNKEFCSEINDHDMYTRCDNLDDDNYCNLFEEQLEIVNSDLEIYKRCNRCISCEVKE